MKIAIVYNRESQAVINLFGIPNKEKYGMDTINRVKAALKAKNHQVRTFEGDKNIIHNLETFMPKVISGERPGLVFNLSYGIQGKGRYMHIPGILEMLGIPYVGSSPETHAIALDKVITKMILLQRGIPTPRFAVLEHPDDPLKEALNYPLIVKPKSEAVSFGLRIVHNEKELFEGVKNIYDEFQAPTLVEEYIDGREVNVGLLGNNPVMALPPLELVFSEGEKIFTFEDKTSRSLESRVQSVCPAPLGEELSEKVKSLAIKTFKALGCYDSARVDFRIDKNGNPYVLEVNSMASLGANASYVQAANIIGLPYDKLVQNIIDIASERYFGPYVNKEDDMKGDKVHEAFSYITQNRDRSEQELKSWMNLLTFSHDPVSKQAFIRRLDLRLKKLGIKQSQSFTDGKSHWFFQNKKGYQDGTVFVIPIDIPGLRSAYPIPFRKEPERLFGEGIASARAGLVSVLKTLETLHHCKALEDIPIGIFIYGDEGLGMRYSGNALKRLSKRGKQFFIMHPSYNENRLIHQRRGSMKLNITIEGSPLRVGTKNITHSAMKFFLDKLPMIDAINQSNLSLSIVDLNTSRYSMLMPHRISATLYITYLDSHKAKLAEKKLRDIFKSKNAQLKTFVETLEVRPPFIQNESSKKLLETLKAISSPWVKTLESESTLLPSPAGLIDNDKAVVCGLVPGSKKLHTAEESINRTEWVQKTLLITEFLLQTKAD